MMLLNTIAQGNKYPTFSSFGKNKILKTGAHERFRNFDEPQ